MQYHAGQANDKHSSYLSGGGTSLGEIMNDYVRNEKTVDHKLKTGAGMFQSFSP